MSQEKAETVSREADVNVQTLLYPDLDDRLGVASVAVSVVFFILVNEVIARLARHCVTLKMTSQWRWRNLAVSWIHASLCSVGVICCYFCYVHHVRALGDMVDMRPYAAYILTAFSTGYFIYDFLDHIREGQALKLWEVSLHHIACILIFGYNLTYQWAVAFSVLSLMMEVNSVFLHGRKLLQMVQLPFSHWLYRTVVALNLATFVFFRGAAIVLILIGLWHNHHRLSVVYFTALGMAIFYTVILNPVLFWRLLKSDVLRERRIGTAVQQQPKYGDHVIQNGSDGQTGHNVRNGLHTDSNHNKVKES